MGVPRGPPPASGDAPEHSGVWLVIVQPLAILRDRESSPPGIRTGEPLIVGCHSVLFCFSLLGGGGPQFCALGGFGGLPLSSRTATVEPWLRRIGGRVTKGFKIAGKATIEGLVALSSGCST